MSSIYRGSSIPGTQQDECDWTRYRRAQPANIVLPATARWANALPPELRPQSMLGQFPRIANRIANAWDDPSAMRLVFEDLLVSRRASRRGFPPEVANELLRLRAHFAGDAPPPPPTTTRYWSARRMKAE
jgi:hypothetical protein